jgi:hypothetical protein
MSPRINDLRMNYVPFVDETDARRAGGRIGPACGLSEETSPSLHHSAARHPLRDFDKNALFPD